jgi:pterin-4a-carbinolamine dehydratase
MLELRLFLIDACWQNIRDCFKMTTFENFYNDLLELVSKYEKNNIPIKIEQDLESNIIKIFGENITSLSRAKHGMMDVSELAFATAEHHPFWNLLYNCSEISSTVLEKWKDELSKKDFEDIEWAIKEISQTLEKLKAKSH